MLPDRAISSTVGTAQLWEKSALCLEWRMIFGQVMPKNRPSFGNRTIWGNRPSIIMQAYITLCIAISPSRALHQKSIVECQQTLYILCYKSIFKLCMVLTIGIQDRAFFRLLRQMWKKYRYTLSIYLLYISHSVVTRALVYFRKDCAHTVWECGWESEVNKFIFSSWVHEVYPWA